MKKTKIKKFIALALAVVMIAAFFTGCAVFEYDEDADREQAIVEIAPIGYDYEVPVTVDYEDSYGNKVYEIDTDPSSEKYGETTDEVVSAVKRDHNGDPIHVPATSESGEILYEENVTVEDGKNRDNHFIVYENNPDYKEGDDIGRKFTATEYRFDGVVTRSGGEYAHWINLDDGSSAYGKVSFGENDDPATEEADDAFPTVEYVKVGDNFDTSRDLWEWHEPVIVYETAHAETEAETFYKDTVIDYFESSGYSLYNDSGYTIDKVFDEAVKQLYTRYLSLAEAEKAIMSGDVEWGVPQRNEVEKSVYDQIDTALEQLYTEIANEFGESYPSISEGSDDESADYPTPPEEEPSGEDPDDFEVWNITLEHDRCIGNSTDASVNSLRRAGLRRFVDVVEDYVDGERAISAEDRARFEADIADMRDRIKTAEGTDRLYVILSSYSVIRFMYAESQEYTIKTEGLRDDLVSTVTASEANARAAFEEELARQKREYKADISTYYSEATGDTTILYFADEEIFWVKHILIPFSDEQTELLEKYKAAGHSDAEVEDYRRSLGMNVEVYKHVDGNADTSKAYTIQQAYADIRATMVAASGSAKEAALAFDELIYTYNTDEGIFDNEMGYAVTATPEALGGQAESYMIEFARESRALYNAYRKNMSLDEFKNSDLNDDYAVDPDFTAPAGEVEVGSISVPVLTDYGWHIMFLNVAPKAGEVRGYNSYLTAAEISTAGEAFVEDVTTRSDNYYNNWVSSMANGYYRDGSTITVYKNRFGTYLDDYEEYYAARAEQEAEQEAAQAEQEAQQEAMQNAANGAA